MNWQQQASDRRLLRLIESFANEGGMLSEQIWDAPDVPGKRLFFGKPSGAAMPLVWAHAEYIALKRSLRDGRISVCRHKRFSGTWCKGLVRRMRYGVTTIIVVPSCRATPFLRRSWRLRSCIVVATGVVQSKTVQHGMRGSASMLLIFRLRSFPRAQKLTSPSSGLISVNGKKQIFA